MNSKQSSASGEIQITATANVGGKTITDTKTLVIKVPNLQKLSTGNGYSLVGSTPQHTDNHYGTASVNTALRNIASDYSAKYKGSILRYNDQSLVWGGVFDLGAGWVSSHFSHSCGTDIDVGFTDTNGKHIVAGTLAQLIKKYYPGGFVIVESVGTSNAHYHIHFANCT